MKKHRLGLLPAVIICGLASIAYKIFRSPELDKEIQKFAAKESAKHPD